jgi:hypothetical protein
VQLARDFLAVVDTDGCLNMFKGFYHVTHSENTADSEVLEEGIDAEAKIKPDIAPPKRK